MPVLEKFQPVPVKIRGTLFPSMSAAARHFGLTPSAIQSALNNGTLESVGLRKQKSLPLVLNGVFYPSLNAAARATSIPYETLRQKAKKECQKRNVVPGQSPLTLTVSRSGRRSYAPGA